jgi:uncharacterized protein
VQARESTRTGADYHTFSFDPSQPLKIGARDADRSPQLEIADTGLKLDIDALDAERGRITLSGSAQEVANSDVVRESYLGVAKEGGKA